MPVVFEALTEGAAHFDDLWCWLFGLWVDLSVIFFRDSLFDEVSQVALDFKILRRLFASKWFCLNAFCRILLSVIFVLIPAGVYLFYQHSSMGEVFFMVIESEYFCPGQSEILSMVIFCWEQIINWGYFSLCLRLLDQDGSSGVWEPHCVLVVLVSARKTSFTGTFEEIRREFFSVYSDLIPILNSFPSGLLFGGAFEQGEGGLGVFLGFRKVHNIFISVKNYKKREAIMFVWFNLLVIAGSL